MKHKALVLVIVSIILAMLVLTIGAAEEYLPFSSGANSVSISLNISGGTATATGGTTALASGTYAKTTVYVQKLVDTKWTTIASSSGGASAQASCSVGSGYYRGRVVGQIYNSSGEKVDELSKNTSTKQVK